MKIRLPEDTNQGTTFRPPNKPKASDDENNDIIAPGDEIKEGDPFKDGEPFIKDV